MTGGVIMPDTAGELRSTREHHHVRTSCGRDLTVGRLALGNSGHAPAPNHRAGGVPPQRTGALLAVASHCTVHNTLRQHPDVSIELS